MQDNISYEHLPQHTRELADTALRGPGDKLFAVHAAVLAVASEHLASLISCGREEAGPSAAGLLVVSVLPAEAPPLDEGVLNDATFGAWLKAIYSRDGRPGFEVRRRRL